MPDVGIRSVKHAMRSWTLSGTVLTRRAVGTLRRTRYSLERPWASRAARASRAEGLPRCLPSGLHSERQVSDPRSTRLVCTCGRCRSAPDVLKTHVRRCLIRADAPQKPGFLTSGRCLCLMTDRDPCLTRLKRTCGRFDPRVTRFKNQDLTRVTNENTRDARHQRNLTLARASRVGPRSMCTMSHVALND